MLAHVIELRPTRAQENYFLRCAGTSRFVYNELVKLNRSQTVKYNRKAYQKHISTLRQNTPWMQEVSSRAAYEAVDQFHAAMMNFFKSCKGERKGRKAKPPAFKKRHQGKSFRFSHNSQFSVNGRDLRIGGLKETISMRERIRFSGTVKSVTIRQRAGKWFASFLVDADLEARCGDATREPSVGVDLGLGDFAVLSTGEKIAAPRHLRSQLRLLRRRQRQVSRKVKGSRRRAVAQGRVSRLHKKITDRRTAFHHGVANLVLGKARRVVIEDLAVSAMTRNRRLALSVADAGWGSFRRILEYKAPAYGVEIVVADRFFPSSKTCSGCGSVKESLTLRERTYRCECCGLSIGRDLNAAINLSSYTLSPPIRGRRKTDAKAVSKPSAQAGAAAFDCVNNQELLTRDSAETDMFVSIR